MYSHWINRIGCCRRLQLPFRDVKEKSFECGRYAFTHSLTHIQARTHNSFDRLLPSYSLCDREVFFVFGYESVTQLIPERASGTSVCGLLHSMHQYLCKNIILLCSTTMFFSFFRSSSSSVLTERDADALGETKDKCEFWEFPQCENETTEVIRTKPWQMQNRNCTASVQSSVITCAYRLLYTLFFFVRRKNHLKEERRNCSEKLFLFFCIFVCSVRTSKRINIVAKL